MDRAILQFLDGTTQSFPFSGNPNSLLDFEGKLFLPTTARYDSIMGGRWLAYEELGEAK